MIKGFQEVSFIDFPDTIAAVIFTGGCMFRCPFCHNKDLAMNSLSLKDISLDYVLARIKERSSVLGGVVITGGEPTIHAKLPELLLALKKTGLKIKLDTAGINPDMLTKVLPYLDYIAMDIKHTPKKYSKATGRPVQIHRIEKSIAIIKNSGIPYEFRTTVVPTIHTLNDFHALGKFISGSTVLYLQKFIPNPLMIDITLTEKPSDAFLLKAQTILQSYVSRVEIRSYT